MTFDPNSATLFDPSSAQPVNDAKKFDVASAIEFDPNSAVEVKDAASDASKYALPSVTPEGFKPQAAIVATTQQINPGPKKDNWLITQAKDAAKFDWQVAKGIVGGAPGAVNQAITLPARLFGGLGAAYNALQQGATPEQLPQSFVEGWNGEHDVISKFANEIDKSSEVFREKTEGQADTPTKEMANHLGESIANTLALFLPGIGIGKVKASNTLEKELQTNSQQVLEQIPETKVVVEESKDLSPDATKKVKDALQDPTKISELTPEEKKLHDAVKTDANNLTQKIVEAHKTQPKQPKGAAYEKTSEKAGQETEADVKITEDLTEKENPTPGEVTQPPEAIKKPIQQPKVVQPEKPVGEVKEAVAKEPAPTPVAEIPKPKLQRYKLEDHGGYESEEHFYKHYEQKSLKEHGETPDEFLQRSYCQDLLKGKNNFSLKGKKK